MVEHLDSCEVRLAKQILPRLLEPNNGIYLNDVHRASYVAGGSGLCDRVAAILSGWTGRMVTCRLSPSDACVIQWAVHGA